MTEIDTLKSIFDRPVPELDRFLFPAKFSVTIAVNFPSPPCVDSQPRRAAQKSKHKNRSSSGTGWSIIDSKVSISVKIQFPSDFVKHKNRKSDQFRFFRFWGRFFKIFSPGGVPEGGSIFTIMRPQGPNTSKNTNIFQKEFFFIYSATSLL